MEESYLAVTEFKRYRCDVCKTGVVKYIPQFNYIELHIPHKCDNCGKDYYFDDYYDRVGAKIKEITEQDFEKLQLK